MSAFQVNGSPRAYIASSLGERTSTVHPHACGEHRTHRYLTASFIGSSPRMWGTPEAGRRKLEAHRFIPTHVGNTVGDPPTWAWRPVHPHACGEHGVADMGTFIPGGSSPRMWGTQAYRLIPTVIPRFIPTHVGNTVPRKSPSGWRTVHPHACGEHLECVGKRLRSGGSSPRMWGTPSCRCAGWFCHRFIPTHVGNTHHGSPRWCPVPVHPHACGEHPGIWLWGWLADRFIPTHVGNTLTVQNCF